MEQLVGDEHPTIYNYLNAYFGGEDPDLKAKVVSFKFTKAAEKQRTAQTKNGWLIPGSNAVSATDSFSQLVQGVEGVVIARLLHKYYLSSTPLLQISSLESKANTQFLHMHSMTDAVGKLACWHRLFIAITDKYDADYIIVDLNPAASTLNFLALLA